MKEMLLKMKGGSHAYGLATATSDIDWRGVFVSTELNYIVGLDAGREEGHQRQVDGIDEVYWELRHFMRMLRGGNTQALEMMFKELPDQITDEFKLIVSNRFRLIDSVKMFSTLRGYATSERRLANGERTGQLGGKRKEAIDKYGFSPKNFVQLFRLLWAGAYFYKNNVFPVDVSMHSASMTGYLLDVKISPHLHQKEVLNQYADNLEQKLIEAFEAREKTYEFDEALANEICAFIYKNQLQNALKKSKYEIKDNR